MIREPVPSQTYNPALERDKKNPGLETNGAQTKPNPENQTEPSKLENPKTAQYEVLLEQLGHDMAYQDKLTPEQLELLGQFGYSDGGLIDGPFGFEMRSFIPSKTEYPHPVLAFRGTELTKLKDLVADLEPQSVGTQQFNANRRRIELEMQKLSEHGKVWLTGHSHGGALAQLAGSEFANLTGRIVTFQSPAIDAKHVAQLKKFNKANPDKAVQSTHYQVAGDVVSGVGEALTPGELVRFDMNPSNGATMKHYAVGMIAGAVVGPGTGVVVKEAADKVAKHRAFPVTNAVQENPAFQDLFEKGKKFDKVAGISDSVFQTKATINSDTFQNTRISEFLRHTIGKTSFEVEHAVSNWGGDAKAREFAEHNRSTISKYGSTELLEHLNHLLNGWVSDDDVQAFETICYGVTDPKIMAVIRSSIYGRLEELHSEYQRKWIENALNFKPNEKEAVQREKLEGATVQRDALSSENTNQQIQNLNGGNVLESTQRKELEEHFGVELGDVRVHTDENATKIAQGLNAKAAAIGNNIILGKDASTTDKELMGHEVAHTIQQRSGKVGKGIDPDSSLETQAKLEGQNFANGTKVRGKRAMLEPKKPNADAVQRKEAAKTTDTAWTRDFTGITGKNTVGLHLTRETDGNLKGTYQLNQSPAIEVSGKILESKDNDLFLEGADGSKWHGKYTETNTLLFGNIVLPKQTLKNLELKTNTTTTPVNQAPTGVIWKDRVINATINGNRFMMKLDKTNSSIKADEFYLETIGAGKAVGELEPNTLKIKKFEFAFTSGEKKGETREIQEGFFVLLNGGKAIDLNKDGKNDATNEDLTLELKGNWVNPKTGMKYAVEPYVTSSGGAWEYNPKSGNKNFTPEVAAEVLWAAGELEVNPNDLAACMGFESGGSFDPAQPNLGGGAAVGLIQFLPPSLEQMRRYIALGARDKAIANEIKKYSWDSSKLNRASLIAMSVKEQMRYVVLHFKAHYLQPGSTFIEMYQKILAPNSDPNAMYVKGSAGYRDNEPLDKNGDDKITAAEAASVIEDKGHVRDYFLPAKENVASVAQKQNTPQSQSATANPIAAQQQDPNHVYTVTTLTDKKKIQVKASQMSMQGAYPTDIATIDWQNTSIATTKTANALSDVRDTPVKIGDDASQTATEFLASGRDYGNLTTKDGIKQVHTGWDLNIVGDGDKVKNKPAFFAADGVVVFVGDVSGFRKIVVVYHPQLNLWTRYAHLHSYAVQEGAVIKAGQQLGIIGNAEGTQPAHLHFDVIKNLQSPGMWNGASGVKNGDYDKDGNYDVDDRIEYVKENYEDPAAFFAKVSVTIPKEK
jgi:murein DD-endopeptidase MepM/ murein hydrolase activator NlpD